MSLRTLLLLIIAVPALIVGGAIALGVNIPVPLWGRDYVLSFVLDDPVDVTGLPEIYGPDDPATPLVVIDAGHGGRDLGAVGGGLMEKDIVLDISLKLKDLLVQQGGIRIAMTRERDAIVALGRRPEIARDLNADLFLSIHADSGGSYTSVSGASIYTLSNDASSEAAALFAARENEVDLLNGVDIEGQDDAVSAILVELSQGRTQEDATEFSQIIEREGEGRIVFHPQAQRQASLVVLRAPDVPGVLFESGFVSNREDRARLGTQEGRDEYAAVLARSIRVYFARRDALLADTQIP